MDRRSPPSWPLAGRGPRGGALPLDVRGLLFEPEDVFYDASAWRRWLIQVLARLGLHTHPRTFGYLLVHDYLAPAQRGECDVWTAVRRCLLSAGLRPAQVDEVLIAGPSRWRQCEDELRPLRGVAAVLAELSARGIRWGVAANACEGSSAVRARLGRLGLAAELGCVVSSHDLACTKPDRAVYAAALRLLGLTPQQAAFVSASPDDLAGAAAMGMWTIACNAPPDCPADVRLDDFEQLLGIVPQSAACRALAG